MQRAAFYPGDNGVYESPLVIPNVTQIILSPGVQELTGALAQRGFHAAQVKITVFLDDGTSYTVTLDPSGDFTRSVSHSDH